MTTNEKKAPKPLTASQYTTRFKTINRQYNERVEALAEQALVEIVIPFCKKHDLIFSHSQETYAFVNPEDLRTQSWDGTAAPDGYIDVYTVLQTLVFDGTRLFQHMSDYTP